MCVVPQAKYLTISTTATWICIYIYIHTVKLAAIGIYKQVEVHFLSVRGLC